MKKLSVLAALLIGSLSLTACGGDSDSSGSASTSTTTAPTTPPTTNPTTTTTSPKPTIPACEVSGSNINGKKGSSCTFSIPNYNSGATSTLNCPASGGVDLGGITAGKSVTLNNYTIQCI